TAATRLEQTWPEARRYNGPAAEAIPRAFAECDAIVSFLAVGATVRLIAPLLTSKTEDPAVVCVDENLRYAVPVLGAHQGGGNDLARRVAAALGAGPACRRRRGPGRGRGGKWPAYRRRARWAGRSTSIRSAYSYGGCQSGRGRPARGRRRAGLASGHLPGQPARRGTGAPPERGSP